MSFLAGELLTAVCCAADGALDKVSISAGGALDTASFAADGALDTASFAAGGALVCGCRSAVRSLEVICCSVDEVFNGLCFFANGSSDDDSLLTGFCWDAVGAFA